MKKATKPNAAGEAKRRASKKGGRVPLSPARRSERSDSGDAFIPDPNGGPARTFDDLAEVLAEDFIESATRGNEVFEDDLDKALPDEVGGPFVVTDPRDELVDDIDESNPADAEVEPLPRANAGLVQNPREEGLDDELRAETGDDDLETEEDADVGLVDDEATAQRPPRPR